MNGESAVSRGPVVTFFSTNLPEDCPDIKATICGNSILSGVTVGRNDVVTFTAQAITGYHIDWYVNGELYVSPDGVAPQSLSLAMNGRDRLKVEGQYVENFKYIFKGTPFVKYADDNGVIVVPPITTTTSMRDCAPSAIASRRGREATARPTALTTSSPTPSSPATR